MTRKKHTLTPIERRVLSEKDAKIVLASKDKPITDYPESRVHKFSEELSVFCTGKVNKTACKQIAAFLIGSYYDMTLAEINIAFNLAATGKLDVDPEIYNSFAPLYVGRIINAYRRYKSKLIERIRHERLREDKQHQIEAVTPPGVVFDKLAEHFLHAYKTLNRESPEHHFTWVDYDFLVSAGILPENAYKRFVEEAKQKVKMSNDKGIVETLQSIRSGRKDEIQALQIENKAKSLCVFSVMRDKKEKKISSKKIQDKMLSEKQKEHYVNNQKQKR